MTESKKRNTNKNALLLLTGAIVGAAATYYLHTPKGKELTQKVVNKSKEVGDTITNKAQAIVEEVKDSTSKAIALAAENIEATKETLITQSNEIIDEVETNATSFQKGMKKAKESVKNGAIAS